MVVFAALLMAASYLISQLTAGQDMKIIKDLGLAAISWFGLLIAIFIGIGLVSKEVDRRSVYALLAKPVTRGQFVLGKYAGLVFTLIVNLSAMTLAFTVVLFYMDAVTAPAAKAGWPAPALDPRLLVGVMLTVAELMIVTGDRAVLLHLLEPAAGGAPHLRPLGRGPLQPGPTELRGDAGLARRSSGSAGRSTSCCRTSHPSTSAPKSCTASTCPLAKRPAHARRMRPCTSRSCWSASIAVFRRKDFK